MKNIIAGLKFIGELLFWLVIVLTIALIFAGILLFGSYLWRTGQYIWAIPYTCLLLVIIAYFIGKLINSN